MNNGSFRCITIFFVQMFLNITACVDKHEERANVDIAGPYCRIENLQSYYNGLFFTLKISLDYDCYDMDEYGRCKFLSVKSKEPEILRFWAL